MVQEGLNPGIVSGDKIFLKKQKIETGKNFLSYRETTLNQF